VKRLLVLTPAPISSASTRFRLTQFFPALERAGIVPVLRPFLDERGFGLLYRRGAVSGKLVAAARAVGGRVLDLARSLRADAVLIHREAALVGPPIFERLLAARLPILFDIDDPVWVYYDSPTYGATLSRLLKAPGKTAFTIQAAARVITGNQHLADYVRRIHPRVEVIPTVVDTAEFTPGPPRTREVPVIGWIGTHSAVQYLRAIVPALRELARRRRFVVRVIGGTLEAPGVPIEQVDWSLEREASDFRDLDIGLYPLVEDAWSLGKSGFKAVQYMASGVPVVASPVGVTCEMIRHGENGFLARSQEDWVLHLEQLLGDDRLRRRFAEQGRADAESRWSRTVQEPRFVAAVEQTLSK
jgi:glycosyltransferase involved in cell wall biosynthesis